MTWSEWLFLKWCQCKSNLIYLDGHEFRAFYIQTCHTHSPLCHLSFQFSCIVLLRSVWIRCILRWFLGNLLIHMNPDRSVAIILHTPISHFLVSTHKNSYITNTSTINFKLLFPFICLFARTAVLNLFLLNSLVQIKAHIHNFVSLPHAPAWRIRWVVGCWYKITLFPHIAKWLSIKCAWIFQIIYTSYRVFKVFLMCELNIKCINYQWAHHSNR